MQLDDIKSVVEIEQRNFKTPWTEQAFIYEVKKNPHSLTLVAEADGKPIGYSISFVIIDEMHIANLSVDHKFRQQKIGQALLKCNFEYAHQKQCMSITLEVRRSNRAAVRLYQKFGFKQVGLRRGYYEPEREDALIMSKSIGFATLPNKDHS